MDVEVNNLASSSLLCVSRLFDRLSSSGYRCQWFYPFTIAASSRALWAHASLALPNTSGRSHGMLVTLEDEEVQTSLASFKTPSCL